MTEPIHNGGRGRFSPHLQDECPSPEGLHDPVWESGDGGGRQIETKKRGLRFEIPDTNHLWRVAGKTIDEIHQPRISNARPTKIKGRKRSYVVGWACPLYSSTFSCGVPFSTLAAVFGPRASDEESEGDGFRSVMFCWSLVTSTALMGQEVGQGEGGNGAEGTPSRVELRPSLLHTNTHSTSFEAPYQYLVNWNGSNFWRGVPPPRISLTRLLKRPSRLAPPHMVHS